MATAKRMTDRQSPAFHDRTAGRETASRTSPPMPRRSRVTPQVPRSSKRWTAVAAPNCREAQEPRMHSTGSVIDGAAPEDVVVLTPVLCARTNSLVQLRYPDNNGEVC
ncbi:hypothetical protein CVA01_25410 [Corynebacterium variabile]|uniref:Uncharacterized protein n=1 Tax=Corynebacterium variabile TaxID=1727 RepID=A0A4Y4C856_9CORY|nr:hypothetical protein CVA01_25410 [Corynebacterium variabile]